MLSLLIFLPIFIALLLLFVPSGSKHIFRWTALSVTVGQLAISFVIYLQYNISQGSFQLTDKTRWIYFTLGDWGAFAADYWVGVDGLSLPLILMSIIIGVIAVIASWNINHHQKGYFILLLILNGSVLGAFAAMDALLFFVFFEFMLIPMYFLIGIWGGKKREYASIKFFLYTLLGSIFILIAIIVLYTCYRNPESQEVVEHTFGIPNMMSSDNIIKNSILYYSDSSSFAFDLNFSGLYVFLCLLIGFAIKIPAVPLHTWLPDAHVEAPTPISIVLAALLLKVGGYGLIRLGYSILPNDAHAFSLFIGILAAISIIYGALNALACKDLKRMIAYSSISHMGFVLLGMASGTVEGITGSIYQMVSHGFITAMLFAIAGVLYDRTNDRTIANYSGLFAVAPKYTAFVLLAFFAAMGMPGFSAFIGEIMIFFGAFASHQQNELLPAWIPLVAVIGVILTASYYVWTIQRMFFGRLFIAGDKTIQDITLREWLILLPLAFIILLLGIFPQPLIDLIQSFAMEANFIEGR